MLPILLLPLLISFPPCFSGSIIRTTNSPLMSEFIKNVGLIEASVKGCKENCSSTHMTEPKCRCFNSTVSHENCTSPGSFRSGLEALGQRVGPNDVIRKLSRALRRMSEAGQNITCPLPVPISPKVFLGKLKIMAEKINSTTK